MVVTGDITQIDLPRAKPSGLIEARAHPRATSRASTSTPSAPPTSSAIPLVQRIIDAYDTLQKPDRPRAPVPADPCSWSATLAQLFDRRPQIPPDGRPVRRSVDFLERSRVGYRHHLLCHCRRHRR